MNFPLAKGKYSKPARTLARILGFMGLAVWLFYFYIWYQYDATRPRQPDALAGRLYAQNSHGHVVYLTKEEDAKLTRLNMLALSLVLAGFLTLPFAVLDRFPNIVQAFQLRRQFVPFGLIVVRSFFLIGRQMTFVFEMMSPAFFAANCCFVFRHISSPMQTNAVGATFVLFLAVDPPKTFL